MISNDFLKFIYQISIQFWITNALLHKFFQTDMIFFDQFKVPTIKFGKCFAEFMIPIALLKKFGGQVVSLYKVYKMMALGCRLTLTYSMARSNWVICTFEWGKLL